MMKKLSFVLGALGISLLGCGTESSGPELLPDLEVPAVPDNGVQVITPIFEDIQPGSDNEVCAWTDVILDKETDIRMTAGYQTEPPGHHAVLFYTLDKQPVGQRVCTDTDMASEIQAGSAAAAKLPKQLVSDPADVAAEGVQALMSGQVVIVPGLPNKITAAWAQVTPHWLTRYVTGLATRRTDWLKKP